MAESDTCLICAETPEPTRSGTFLSFKAFLHPKWKISEGDFPWDEPMKTRDPNLFGMANE